MGIQFPNAPAQWDYHVIPGGPLYRYRDAIWTKGDGTALPKNKVVNPCAHISQQNGDTLSAAIANGGAYYMADEWYFINGGGTTAQLTAGRVVAGSLISPNGSHNRVRMTVTTAQATITSGNYIMVRFVLEGNRISDLGWGTAAAIPAVLRFGFKGPAGTYTACVRNGSILRTYICPFTVAPADANQDREYSFPILPCFDATWPIDNNLGLEIDIVLSSAAVVANTPFVWVSGSSGVATPVITNNVSVVGNVFEIFDVGFYPDPRQTGVAPPFEVSDFIQDRQDCMRYWYRLVVAKGHVRAATLAWVTGNHPVPMRIGPSYALVLTGNYRGYDGTVAPNITSISAANMSTPEVFDLPVNLSAGGLTVGRSFNILADGKSTDYIAVSARF